MKTPWKNFKERRRSRQTWNEGMCGLAFDVESDEVVIAEYARGGSGEGFEVSRVARRERRAIDLTARRIRTTVRGWSAHTDQTRLPLNASSTDEQILRAIREAAQDDPNARAFAYAPSRTPDGRLVITQADRNDIDLTVAECETWLAEQRAPHITVTEQRVQLETQIRSIARVWLYSAPEKLDPARSRETGTIAFLIVGRDGYGLGLWSGSAGLKYETEEMFELGATELQAASHTHESLAKLIWPPNLAKQSLAPVTTVVISTIGSLNAHLIKMLGESPELANIRVEQVRLPREGNSGGSYRQSAPQGEALDQATALAIGSLLESETIPRIDLTDEADAQLERITEAQTHALLLEQQRKTHRAVFTMLAPFAICAGLLFAVWIDLRAEGMHLVEMKEVEQKEAVRLQAEMVDRRSAEETFRWLQTTIDLIIKLRLQEQPAAAQLLNDLDQRWPSNDQTWFISDLSSKDATVEIKGKTRRQESIALFARALEYSDGLFSSISTDSGIAGGAALGEQTVLGADAKPIVDFTVRATYRPPSGAPTATSNVSSSSQPLSPSLPSTTGGAR